MKRFLCLLFLLSLASCGISHEIAAMPTSTIPIGAASDPLNVIMQLDEPIPEADVAEETGEPVPEPEPTAPLIYLTFDDGPGKYTETILATLAEYDVKATFFVVGVYVDYFPSRLQAVADAGHAIGCHSMTHAYRNIYETSETIAADLSTWEASVEKALGYIPDEKLYRFPGGSNCTAIADLAPLHQTVTDRGYRCFDWSFANNDRWLVDKPEDMELSEFMKQSVINTLARCSDTRIMLMHDTSGDTAEMLGWIIEYLRGEGYEFATLEEYDGEFIF